MLLTQQLIEKIDQNMHRTKLRGALLDFPLTEWYLSPFYFTCTVIVSPAVNIADYPPSTVIFQSLLMISISNPSFKILTLIVPLLF